MSKLFVIFVAVVRAAFLRSFSSFWLSFLPSGSSGLAPLFLRVLFGIYQGLGPDCNTFLAFHSTLSQRQPRAPNSPMCQLSERLFTARLCALAELDGYERYIYIYKYIYPATTNISYLLIIQSRLDYNNL